MPDKPKQPERRREPRQPAAVPVLVGGKLGTGARFDEKTLTLDVSGRGARVLLRLQIKLEPGSEVTIENLATGKQQVFRVVHAGTRQLGGYEVGLEAAELQADFWGAAAD